MKGAQRSFVPFLGRISDFGWMRRSIVESGGGVVDSGGTAGKLQDSSLHQFSSGGSTRDDTMGEVIAGVSTSSGVLIADSGVMAAQDQSFGGTAVGAYDLRGWPPVDPTIAGVITGDSSSRRGSAADSGDRGGVLVSESSGRWGGMVAGSPCSRGQTAKFWVIFLRGQPNDNDALASTPRKRSLLTSFSGGKEKNEKLNGSPERNVDLCSSAESNSESNWSLVPLELLSLIASTTRDMGDYITFHQTCKSWQKAAKDCKLQGQLPMIPLWLGQDDTSPRFCNIFTDRVYRVRMPEMAGGYYIDPSAHGWMMLSDESFNLFLFNPFRDPLINLPPVMPYIRSDHLDYYTSCSAGNSYRFRWFASLFQWYPFRVGAEFALALVSTSDLLYWRDGINYWIRVAHVSKTTIERVTSHLNRFYIVYRNGDIDVYNMRSEMNPQFQFINSQKVPTEFEDCYLAAVGIDLFMVTLIGGCNGNMQRLRFFKQECDNWLEISKIGCGAEKYMVLIDPSQLILIPETSIERRDWGSCTAVKCFTLVHELDNELEVIMLDNSVPLDVNSSDLSLMSHHWFMPSL